MKSEFVNPLVKQADTALKQANIEALPLLLQRLGRNLLVEKNISVKNRYRLAAARILRVLGRNDLAENLHREMDVDLVPNDSDFFRDYQIEQIGFYLDLGQIENAVSLAETLDGMAMTSGTGRDQVSKVFRNDADITVSSWLIIAEVSLFCGDYPQTVRALTTATRLQMEAEDKFKNRSEKEFISQREKDAFFRADEQVKNTIEFLEAVYSIAAGADWGREVLAALYEKLIVEPHSDKRLIAKINAVSGAWNSAQNIPPRGISLLEARRWSSVFTTDKKTLLAGTELVTGAVVQPEAQTNQSAISVVNRDESAAVLRDLVYGLMDRMDTMMKNNGAKQSSEEDESIFAGKFVEFDLLSMIANLQFKHTNGFIEVTWKPREVETTILAGRLDERCRSGIGYVFFKNGLITDATIGAYDAPKFNTPDEARADARRSLSALFQIGQSIGMDNDLESGRGKAFNSPNVVFREERLPNLENNGIMEIVTQREKELGIEIPAEEEFDFDNMFGDKNMI